LSKNPANKHDAPHQTLQESPLRDRESTRPYNTGTIACARAYPMNLTVNGESRAFPDGTTVAALIDAMALAGKRIAVELNGEIVPRSRHTQTGLRDGDRLEIVVAVGGG
jgi:sulfur carrier protein